ncbi:MAG: hypothetical protein LBJ20_05275 [Candidatus Methanoplasma sp.]|jgi:hypothetical protein|nr:hypothetical protein [Candidatus Methanoplasma sp.]
MTKSDDRPGIAVSLLSGILFTIVLLVIVPALCGHFISRYVTDFVGDTAIMNASSAVIVNLIMWLIIVGFTFALGGGRILKKYGVFGIIGLVVAYWLLGDLMGAVYAIAMLLAVSAIIYVIKSRSNKKKKI